MRKPRTQALLGVLAASVLLAAAGLFGIVEYEKYTMNAMNREDLSQAEFDKALQKALAQGAYAPAAGKERFPVSFEFNLSPALVGDVLFVMGSNSLPKPLYVGPYQDRITLNVGRDVLERGRTDSFNFTVFDKKHHRVFFAEHEAAFWQPDKTIRIDFLPERTMDDRIGGPVAFDVSAR